jgi:hypothetical protein
MGFLTPLDLRAYLPGEWVVLTALVYQALAGIYSVPRGFITDLASIPRVLRSIYERNGLSRRPAVLHDYLYCAQLTTRAEADALFLEALAAEGVGWAMRRSMWLGVRVGGWVYWNRRADGMRADDYVPAGYFEDE